MGQEDIRDSTIGVMVSSNTSGAEVEKLGDPEQQIEPTIAAKKRQSLSDIFTIVSPL
jgi:hypothetical protein